MGQCLEADLQSVRFHPILGRLQERGDVVEASIPIEGEDEYLSWSKRINRLKYSHEGAQLLFLPLTETYSEHSSDLFCDSSQQITLTFKPYADTLYDNLVKNVSAHQPYQEREIWYLMSTLAKYVSLYQKEEPRSRINFHSVLITETGRLRVIPEIVTPSMEVQASLTLVNETRRVRNKVAEAQGKDATQVIGLMCLALAALLHPDTLYSAVRRAWLDLPQKINKTFSFCEKKYSPYLSKTLKQITIANPRERITLAELTKRLQPFESEWEAANATTSLFGSYQTEEEPIFSNQEVLYGDGTSLKNSLTHLLSEPKEDEEPERLETQFCGSFMRKGEIHEADYPSIL